jgi:hypothetical protein
MDIHILETACRSSGMLDSAIEDGVRRLESHFAQQADPSAALIAERLSLLREQAPHLFPRQAQTDAAGVPAGMVPEVWRGLSPATKLSWARDHGYALPVVERRRPPLPLTSEQVAELAALKPEARLAAYRALQAQQQRS